MRKKLRNLIQRDQSMGSDFGITALPKNNL